MDKFTPLLDRVLLRPYPKDTTTKGGIIIADTVAQQVIKAQVVSVGEGRYAKDTGKFMATKLKKGVDVFLFAEAAMPMEVGGENLLLCGEDEILGTE